MSITIILVKGSYRILMWYNFNDYQQIVDRFNRSWGLLQSADRKEREFGISMSSSSSSSAVPYMYNVCIRVLQISLFHFSRRIAIFHRYATRYGGIALYNKPNGVYKRCYCPQKIHARAQLSFSVTIDCLFLFV